MFTELLGVSPEWSATFLLILVRLSAAIMAVPLFGARGVPTQTKIGLALLLSLIVLPLNGRPAPVPTELLTFASLVGSEALVGLAIGIVISMVFQALEMGATLVGVQMGFGLGRVFDPMTGTQIESMTQFYRLIATLVFFAVNGHHLVVVGLLQTFEVVPAGSADLSLIAGERVGPFFATLFVVALRVALPVTGALILTDLAMGLVARTVPQMNVLVVGFPVKIAVGVFALAASIPLLTTFMGGVFNGTLPQVNAFLRP